MAPFRIRIVTGEPLQNETTGTNPPLTIPPMHFDISKNYHQVELEPPPLVPLNILISLVGAGPQCLQAEVTRGPRLPER